MGLGFHVSLAQASAQALDVGPPLGMVVALEKATERVTHLGLEPATGLGKALALVNVPLELGQADRQLVSALAHYLPELARAPLELAQVLERGPMAPALVLELVRAMPLLFQVSAWETNSALERLEGEAVLALALVFLVLVQAPVPALLPPGILPPVY